MADVWGTDKLAPLLIPPPPPPGTGLITGGSIAASAGGITGLSTILLLSVGAGNDPATVGLGISTAALLGGGIAMLVVGHRRRHRYKEWLAYSRIYRGKPAGHGLLVGGGSMLGGSALFFALGAGAGGWTGYVAGAALLAGGGILVGVGVKRKRAYSSWTRQFDGAHSVRWTPTVAPTRGGAMLGAVGRF